MAVCRGRAGGKICALAVRRTGLGERGESSGIDDAPVVDAISGAQYSMAFAGDVPGKAQAWAEVVVVVGEVGSPGNVWVDEILVCFRELLVLVTNSQRNCQPMAQLPLV